MAFFSTLALIFVLVFRPQEIWPALAALRLLDVFTVLAACGVVYEFLLARWSDPWSPQLPFLFLFVGISYVATTANVGVPGVAIATNRAVIGALFMLVVMFGARSVARLSIIMAVFTVLAVFVSGVAVHQGRQELQCIELPADDPEDVAAGTPDGRSCETAHGCENGGHDGVDYACERLGLFKTTSVTGRVRWRGQLEDPNELSVYIGAVIPFLLAFAASSEHRYRWPVVLSAIGLGLYAVVLTQSRGGQLVIGTVFAFVFVRRYGWKGLGAAATCALPVLFFGGREGVAADASAEERIGLLYDGITIVMQRPIFGIGIDQFNEAEGHTAHNAYLLAATELGIPGLLAWSGLFWSSLKIPVALVKRPPNGLNPAFRTMSFALLASFAGMAVGIFFLSFTFKQLMFMWFGMSGALYAAVRTEHPSFQVTTTRKDLLGIVLADAAILFFIFVYTRRHHA